VRLKTDRLKANGKLTNKKAKKNTDEHEMMKITNKKLSYRRETARQLATWKGG